MPVSGGSPVAWSAVSVVSVCSICLAADLVVTPVEVLHLGSALAPFQPGESPNLLFINGTPVRRRKSLSASLSLLSISNAGGLAGGRDGVGVILVAFGRGVLGLGVVGV